MLNICQLLAATVDKLVCYKVIWLCILNLQKKARAHPMQSVAYRSILMSNWTMLDPIVNRGNQVECTLTAGARQMLQIHSDNSDITWDQVTLTLLRKQGSEGQSALCSGWLCQISTRCRVLWFALHNCKTCLSCPPLDNCYWLNVANFDGEKFKDFHFAQSQPLPEPERIAVHWHWSAHCPLHYCLSAGITIDNSALMFCCQPQI